MSKTKELEVDSKEYTSLNNCFKKGDTEIWYTKKIDWYYNLPKRKIPENINALQETHSLLGSINLTNPHQIFYAMQGEIWSPMGQARKLIGNLSLHTSMSVGDIIRFKKTGKSFIVASSGFSEVMIN